MIYITSPSNPTIKVVKSLYRKKDRWMKKSFLVEGIKMVEECIDNNYPLSNIIISDELYNIRGGEALWEKIKNHNKLIKVSSRLFREISQVEEPQGVLAIAEFKLSYIEEIYEKDNPFILILDEVQDPGNMGTIIRTGDAFGIDGIIVTEGCVDIYNPKVVRATMGSIFRMPIYYESNGIKVIEKLKKNNIKIYSTSLEGVEYIQNANLKTASAFIIGNESKGVSNALESLADSLIKIPMLGEAESLNVAVASSIIMYEAMRQRIAM